MFDLGKCWSRACKDTSCYYPFTHVFYIPLLVLVLVVMVAAAMMAVVVVVVEERR